jgi:hypothetical protein
MRENRNTTAEAQPAQDFPGQSYRTLSSLVPMPAIPPAPIDGYPRGYSEREAPGVGMLTVYGAEDHRGNEVEVRRAAWNSRIKPVYQNMVERYHNGHFMMAALFPLLEEGTYTVRMQISWREWREVKISIYDGAVSEVDWRY